MKLHCILLACMFLSVSVLGAPTSTFKNGKIVNVHLTSELYNRSDASSAMNLADPSAGGESKMKEGCHLDTGIYYHGGPVMTQGTNVYLIFYGTFSHDQQSLISNFIKGIGKSEWWEVERTYRDSTQKRISNHVELKGKTNIGYTLGQVLSDFDIETIVANSINDGTFPSDVNGLYYVLTDPTVQETSGFCSWYCGWHTYATIGSSNIKYSFVGNAVEQCPFGCAIQVDSSPNNDVGIDAMISVMAHELAEAVSDPNLDAWFDSMGQENADKCAWTFGDVSVAPNGSFYNIVVNKVNYLIQQLWVNAGNGACLMEY